MSKLLKNILIMLLAVAIAAAAPLAASAQPEPEVERAEAAPADPGVQSQQGSSEGSMETALIAAKNLLNIDDSVYADFNYSSSFSNYETREGLIWSFSWSDSKNGYIYAYVREDGTVLQYNKYSYRDSYFGFAEISKETATGIADGFIKRAKPDTYSYFKSPADVQISIHDSEFRLTYYAEENGYSFKAAWATVGVSKSTGEVTGYNTSNVNPQNFSFESASDIISEGTAVAAYAEKIGLRLEYKSYYNYEDSTLKVFPVYLFNSSGDKYIGAKTGEVVEYVYDLGVDEEALFGASAAMASPEAAYDMAAGGSAQASLTPAEIAAIDKVSSYITSEQALEKLVEAMELTGVDLNEFGDRYISLNRDYYNRDRYSYDINMYRQYAGDPSGSDAEIMGFYGRVDAESGRVMSFSLNYYGIPASSDEYTEEQAAAAVEAFLKKIAPDEFAKSKKEEDRNGAATPYNNRGDYSTNYVRYANEIIFRDNGINVSFNRYTGKVTRYSLNWYDNASFPVVSNVLPPESALSAFVEQSGSDINYITIGNGNAELVYEFNSGAYIDPSSGKALDYTGEQLGDSAVTPDYSDVIGHWSEKIVKRLLENGVYLWGGKFEPDKVMTEYEFLQYLLLLEPYYYRADPTEFFIQRGIDIAADPDKILSRQEAARIVVEYLGYGKLAEQPDRFVYPFSDSVNPQYKGYVTICYMLGIVSGDNGRFNASGSITRAQAAVILQNLIIAKS